MQSKILATVFAAALLFAGAACSSDDGGSGGSGDLASKIQEAAAEEGEDLTDEEADCTAQLLVAVAGEDAVTEAIDEGPEAIAALMVGFEEGGDDPAAMGEMMSAMADLDEGCLETFGVSAEDIEVMQGLTEGMQEGSGG